MKNTLSPYWFAMSNFFWTILSALSLLIPAFFLLSSLIKFANWVNLTFSWFNGGKGLDMSRYGGGNGNGKRPWALITGASDGIGAAFAKVITITILLFI